MEKKGKDEGLNEGLSGGNEGLSGRLNELFEFISNQPVTNCHQLKLSASDGEMMLIGL